MKMKPKSEAVASVHNAIADLYSIGAVDKTTLRHFDELCLETIVADPFYSSTNMSVLRQSIREADEGKFVAKTLDELRAMEKSSK